MSWNDTTKIMTEPLNLNTNGDIQQASGVNSGFLDACIIGGNWNKWAKFKPVKSSKVSPLTLDELKTLNYGLTINVCGPHGNASTFVSNYGSQWAYNQPDGSTGEWYRYQDLTNPSDGSATGYRGDANCFVDVNNTNYRTEYIVGISDVGAVFQLGINTGNNIKEGSITPADMRVGDSIANTPFSSMYFGLMFVSGTGSSMEYRLITAEYPMSGYPRQGYSYPTITIAENNGSLDGINTGTTYTVYWLLSKSSHTSLTPFGNLDEIVALPKLDAFTFKASETSTAQNISLYNVSASIGRGRVTYSFKVYMSASGGAPTSISDLAYTICNASSIQDTSGSQIASGSNISLSTTSPAVINNTVITSLTGEFLWIRAYRGNAPLVSAETWVKVRNEDDDLFPELT